MIPPYIEHEEDTISLLPRRVIRHGHVPMNCSEPSYLITDEDLQDLFKDEITTDNDEVVRVAFRMMENSTPSEERRAWKEFATKQIRPDGRYRMRCTFRSYDQ